MFSKLSIVFLSMILCGAFFVGCTGEDESYADPIVVDLGATQCFSEATQTAEDFLKGKLSETDLIAFWSCASRSVEMFREHVKGKDPRFYSSEEIVAFLHKYFLGEIRINKPLLSSLMEIKRLFVGGSNRELSKPELTRTLEFIDVLRSITLRLRPHMKYVFYNEARLLPPDHTKKIDEAIAVLQSSMMELGLHIRKNNVDYEFSSFTNLLEEFALLFEEHNPDSKFNALSEWAPIFPQFKNIFVGAPLERVESSQWIEMLSATGDILGIWIRFREHIKGSDYSKGLAFYQIVSGADSIVGMFERGIRLRDGQISELEFHKLFETLVENKLLPNYLTKIVLVKTWRVFVGKILTRPSLGVGQKKLNKYIENYVMAPVDPGTDVGHARFSLTEQSIGVMREELSNWAESQEYINSGYFPNKPAVATEGVAELFRLVNDAPWALMNDKNGRLMLSKDQLGVGHNQVSLPSINWKRMLIRNILATYSTEAKRRKKLGGLSESELKTAYFDIKDAMVALGIVDEDNYSFHKKIFFEGNLFLPQSNGDEFLNYQEGVEYAQYALSGLVVGSQIMDELSEPGECPVWRQGDLVSLDVSCFRKKYRNRYSLYHSNLPDVSSWVGELGDLNWVSFETSLENTVRTKGYSGDPIPTGEIVEMTVLTQFLDTFIWRFDTDFSGTISKDEAVYAYDQVYGGMLAGLIPPILDYEGETLDAYLFLLKYGSFPDFENDPIAIKDFWHWIMHPERQVFEVDRGGLAKVLATLNQYRKL